MVLPVWPAANRQRGSPETPGGGEAQDRRLPNRRLPLPVRRLPLPVEMPALHFARLVETRRPAEPQNLAGELVEPFCGIHVCRWARPALLIVHQKRRIVILIRGESSKVPGVAEKRLQGLVQGRLIACIFRPPLILHEVDHHVAGRRIG